MMTKQRDAYWDNLKLVLIFLVTLGHFLLPVSNKGRSVTTVLFWIYLFHMPAFVFVSGFFSRSFVRKENKVYKLNGFLIVYFLFTIAIWTLQLIFKHNFSARAILSPGGAPWYMLTMFFWYLLIPYVSCLRPVMTFPLFILLALLAGLVPECGSFLALSRTIVLFPFFLLGFYFDGRLIGRIRPWMRVLAAVFLLGAAFAMFRSSGRLGPFFRVIYADRSYEGMGLSVKVGASYRSLWLLLSAAMTGALMCLIPRRRFRLSFIGERTLAIYIFHRLLRDIFQYLDLYRYFGSGLVLLFSLMLISAVLVFIGSAKPFTVLLDRCFHVGFLTVKPVKSESADPEGPGSGRGS